MAVLALLLGAWTVAAQDPPKPKENDTKKPAVQNKDGYDRPTSYPKIRFGNKPKPKDGDASAGKADAEKPKAKGRSRVYLLDVSDSMAASITINNATETTRIDHLRTLITRSLEELAKRPEAKRGELRFNLITFGDVQDFAAGGDLLEASADNTANAKEWVKGLTSKGRPNLLAMLDECYAQEPEEATMFVGSAPGKPANVSDEELKKFETPGDYIIDAVAKKRAGKKTTLDIVGVGLSRDDTEFYKRLAKTVGGTYIDG
jgi:hypothetical protein